MEKLKFLYLHREKKKAHLILYVEDNGIGMSQEFQKEMFMPFTQESRKIIGMNGTGLGLAIVKKLVDIMGGKIKVESNLGTGSRFIIEMEVDIAETPKFETEAEDNNSQFNNLNGFRILLCEDNFINQEIMTNILKIMGMEVDIAVNGKQAVEKYLDHEEGYYGAILMDCRMPVMDGYEATKRIRMAHKPDAKILPIIALTADAFEEDKKHCIDVGMNDFLAKPVIIEELKKILIKNIYKTRGK
ncbi:ATP-binding response regulator [Fusobacterium ulcerans]|uniref:ATP-binding response regulator n=1 Tax=Fusobacterium ulcerans TaxID=861 RepID=UPI00267148FA|nr:response regulator [Fusobacterium ulcerans]